MLDSGDSNSNGYLSMDANRQQQTGIVPAWVETEEKLCCGTSSEVHLRDDVVDVISHQDPLTNQPGDRQRCQGTLV